MILPQNNDWQVTLRNHLATLQLQDFDCGLPGLSFDPVYFATDDDIYRTWITFEQLGVHIVGRGSEGVKGIRMDSCNYLLENIEKEDAIYGRLYASYEPAEMAWMYSWNYGGNPYYDNAAVANRALAACMWDMILTHDKFIEGNVQNIDQSVSSTFATYAYTLSTCISVLDPDVADAYMEGLKSFFNVLEAQGAGSDQADLSLLSIVGMWYTARHASGLDDRCETYARAFMEHSFSQAGYIKHGNAMDPSYNGIAINYLSWAALATGYDFLAEALDKICKLKAHMTLVDNGKVYGPSSFATSTSYGSPSDQHASFGRDVATSYVSDDADYLRYGYRNVSDWHHPSGLKDTHNMLDDLESWTTRQNGDRWLSGIDYTPLVWNHSHHLAVPSFEWDYYPEGLYSEVVQEEAVPPFEQEEDFIENFSDEFVAWKLGDMGGILHTGGLSWWPPHNGVGLSGLSGGSLCALWTKQGGISVLGRQRGFAGPTPDTWENIETWAVQHVYGTKDADIFSSAREKSPTVKIITDGTENASIVATGSLGNESYNRGFDISETGLQVRVSVLNHDTFEVLYEVLPLWLGDGYNNAPDTEDDIYPHIKFKIDGMWREPFDSIVVDAVKIERNDHLTLIEFEQPQRVHLGKVWTSEYQIRKERMIPLHIDILETGSVRYTISGPYEHKLKKVT